MGEVKGRFVKFKGRLFDIFIFQTSILMKKILNFRLQVLWTVCPSQAMGVNLIRLQDIDWIWSKKKKILFHGISEVLWTAGCNDLCSFFKFIKNLFCLSLETSALVFKIVTPSDICLSSLFLNVCVLEKSKLSASPTFSWWNVSRCLAIAFFFLLCLISSSCWARRWTALKPLSLWYSARMFVAEQILQVTLDLVWEAPHKWC